MRPPTLHAAATWSQHPSTLSRHDGALHRLVLILLAIAAFLAASGRAEGVERRAAPSDMRSGSLLLRAIDVEERVTEPRHVEAPRLGTDVDLVVSGPTIRARVTQVFQNPTDAWVEAVYVYPLPAGGAVDSMKMVVGERIIVGEIKSRQEARAVYAQARAAGQKAGLLEQERPNIFTSSVANIGPGESVLVQIEYQEPVRQSSDLFSLRVPLVVAPRYSPAPVVQTVDLRADGQGWGQAADPVPDRARIEPPVLDPRQHPPTNPVSISVRLQAGFPLGEVKSHHHPVRMETGAGDTRIITLEDGAVPADRDFELTWRAAAGSAPSVGLFREPVGDADYVLAFITPPALPQDAEAQPRETIFVIDTSGSMGGISIVQAKASLLHALDRLKAGDRFNVIRFDHTMQSLFETPVAADAAHVARAKTFVSAMVASGGTEMVLPMRAALTDHGGSGATHLRQVVFLTDGAIGNEQQLFDTISGLRGRSRVFMVGIGSAPNSFLMTRAAELGRGTFTHIGSVDQVEERMRSLFEKLESPAVTNLAVKFSDGQPDMTPAVLPDLYRGEPLVLAARLETRVGSLTISGMIGERPWSVTLQLPNAADGKGLSKLWARRKIADAEVARTLRRMTPEETDGRILALALEHHLVTRVTSLVAVDKTPSRPEGARLTLAELPLNLPAGWEFEKLFRETPDGAARGGQSPRPRVPFGAPEERRAQEEGTTRYARLARSAAATPAAPIVSLPRPHAGVKLPPTATDAELRLLAGLLLSLMALLLLAWHRRLARGRA
jgi:Ca-activated chloride channel family protein